MLNQYVGCKNRHFADFERTSMESISSAFMAGENMTAGSNIIREQMVQLLNEDLAREYQAIIEINRHINHLGGECEVMSAPSRNLK